MADFVPQKCREKVMVEAKGFLEKQRQAKKFGLSPFRRPSSHLNAANCIIDMLSLSTLFI